MQNQITNENAAREAGQRFKIDQTVFTAGLYKNKDGTIKTAEVHTHIVQGYYPEYLKSGPAYGLALVQYAHIPHSGTAFRPAAIHASKEEATEVLREKLITYRDTITAQVNEALAKL